MLERQKQKTGMSAILSLFSCWSKCVADKIYKQHYGGDSSLMVSAAQSICVVRMGEQPHKATITQSVYAVALVSV